MRSIEGSSEFSQEQKENLLWAGMIPDFQRSNTASPPSATMGHLTRCGDTWKEQDTAGSPASSVWEPGLHRLW